MRRLSSLQHPHALRGVAGFSVTNVAEWLPLEVLVQAQHHRATGPPVHQEVITKSFRKLKNGKLELGGQQAALFLSRSVLTHHNSRISNNHLAVTRYIARSRVSHEFRLRRPEFLSRRQHGNRRAESAHADFLLDNNFV
jgi:hypothetical protein